MDTRAGDIVREENKLRAVKLRKEGWSYYEIGREIGVTEITARRYVVDYLEELRWKGAEELNEVRAIVRARNDDAVKSIYEGVYAGDLDAIDRLIKLNNQLLEMVGAKVTRVDHTTGGGRPMSSTPIHTIEIVLSEFETEVEDKDASDPVEE